MLANSDNGVGGFNAECFIGVRINYTLIRLLLIINVLGRFDDFLGGFAEGYD